MSFDLDRQITNWITDTLNSQLSLLASHWVVLPSIWCRFLPRANDSHLFPWLLKNNTSSLPLATLMGWNWAKFLAPEPNCGWPSFFLLYQENTPPSFSSLLETTINIKHHRTLGHTQMGSRKYHVIINKACQSPHRLEFYSAIHRAATGNAEVRNLHRNLCAQPLN